MKLKQVCVHLTHRVAQPVLVHLCSHHGAAWLVKFWVVGTCRLTCPRCEDPSAYGWPWPKSKRENFNLHPDVLQSVLSKWVGVTWEQENEASLGGRRRKVQVCAGVACVWKFARIYAVLSMVLVTPIVWLRVVHGDQVGKGAGEWKCWTLIDFPMGERKAILENTHPSEFQNHS